MRIIKTGIIAMVLSVVLFGCGKSAENTGGSLLEFIKGADLSSLEAVEDYGGVFYDWEGQETDAMEFLVENGCNYVRLRVWNDPVLSFDAGDYCNLEHTVEMAKRVRESGAGLLLDFHYSDWWADPKNQTVPAAWEGMDVDEMSRALYEYTAEVLNALKEAEAYPDMVQIGNEIGNGMLWEYGSLEHPEALAAFLNSGIQAVRDTAPEGKSPRIMIHVQDGGSVEQTEKFFAMLEEQGVTDYDIVGLSYYPYWHGTFKSLKNNINNVYEKFKKPVIVVETAYPFTYESMDNRENVVNSWDLMDVGFLASEENQRLIYELVMRSVAECEGGLGVFYWEPAWLSVEGAGVAKDTGNEWENQALFDFDGKPLSAINVFGFERGKSDKETALHAYPFQKQDIHKDSTKEEVAQELPKSAQILYSNGDIVEEAVTWNLSSLPDTLEEGKVYIIEGTAMEFQVSVEVNAMDKYSLNNLDFEQGNKGWTIEKDTTAGKICMDDDSYPHDGKWSFHYWNADSFTINLHQTARILEDGQYYLQIWSQGIGDTGLEFVLYLEDEEGNVLDSVVFRNEGWNIWQHPCVTADLKKDQVIRLGVKVNGTGGDWGTLDGVTFGMEKNISTEKAEEAASGLAEGEMQEEIGIPENNILQNASFEGGIDGWEVVREATEAGVPRNDSEGHPYSGEWSFHYWDDKAFTIDVSQQVNIPESGIYYLKAHTQGDEETGSVLLLYAKDADGQIIASVEMINQGWNIWQIPELELQLDEQQSVTVGVLIQGNPGAWGTVDDILLYPGEDE